jgi:peptidoglycan/LPS O-acetylase OafA/YrhL
MYVWQTLFLQHGAIPDPAWLARLKIFPIDLAIIFVCSIASYYLLERPMIRLGRKAVRAASRQPRLTSNS